jgi:hypothetical protein
MLRLAYSGPPIIEPPDQRLRRILTTIGERCDGYLTPDDLALILRPQPAAKPKPKAKAKRSRSRRVATGSEKQERGKNGG